MEYLVNFISALLGMWEMDTVFTLKLLASIGPITFEQIWGSGRDFGLIGGGVFFFYFGFFKRDCLVLTELSI